MSRRIGIAAIVACLIVFAGQPVLAQNGPDNAQPSKQVSAAGTDGRQGTVAFSFTTVFAGLAILVSVVSLLVAMYERRRAREEAKIKLLLGEKEAVSHKAFEILQRGRLDVKAKYARDQLTALCLAAVLEGSDRARAIVIGALKRLRKRHRREIRAVIDKLEKEYQDFEITVTDGEEKIERGKTRIADLRTSLGLKSMPAKDDNANSTKTAPQKSPNPGSVCRLDYLLECHRTANEELLFRFKQRDNWVKIQLLAQAAILALGQGIELGGVKGTSPVPIALLLAIPVALITTALYVVEDRVIAHVIRYVAGLSDEEAEISSSDEVLDNLEKSYERWAEASGTDMIKLVGKSLAFVIVPASLAVYGFIAVGIKDAQGIVALVINGLCAAVIIALLLWAFFKRKSERANAD